MSNKNLKLVIYCSILALVLVLAGVAYNYVSDNYTPEVQNIDSDKNTNPAPDFFVFTQDGERVSFTSFKGKPVVINFWATWCGYCVDELPYFQNAYEKYGDKVQFMMVNLTDNSTETVEKASAFISDKKYEFPVYYDVAYRAAFAYDISAVPVTAFVDADGNLVYHRIGGMTEKMLFEYIESLIGE